MDIAFGINDSFVLPCGVLIISILRIHKDNSIHFHIFTESISEKNRELLNECIQGSNCDLKFYTITNTEILKAFPNKAFLGMATYYRLWIPYLLPETISRILYLDSDMLCVDTLLDLWETDISNYAAAVSINQESDNITYANRIGYSIDDGHLYFNAGMLLINVEYWRKNDICERCLSFFEKFPNRWKFPGQDSLNYSLLGSCKIVSFRYNCGDFSEDVKCMFVRNEYHKDIEDGQRNPAILHFRSSCKPWHKEFVHPYQALWLYMKKLSPWKNQKLKSIDASKFDKFKMKLLKLFGRKIFEQLGFAHNINPKSIDFFPIINTIISRYNDKVC